MFTKNPLIRGSGFLSILFGAALVATLIWSSPLAFGQSSTPPSGTLKFTITPSVGEVLITNTDTQKITQGTGSQNFNFDFGSYRIDFKDIPNYSKPDSIDFSLSEEQPEKSISAAYTPVNQCPAATPFQCNDGRCTTTESECSANIDNTTVCTTDYSPVCGTNNITYSNRCELDKANSDWSYDGECRVDNNAEQNNAEGDYENAQRWMEDALRWLKDRQRERDRNFKGLSVDLDVLDRALSAWKTVLDKMNGLLNQRNISELWNTQRDEEQSAREDVDAAFEQAYAQSQHEGLKNEFENRERELKNMERQMKEFQRENRTGSVSTADLEGYISGYRNKWSELRKRHATLDPLANNKDELDDISFELNDLNHDFSGPFYDAMNELWEVVNRENQKKNFDQFFDDAERNFKDKDRELKKLDREKINTAALKAVLQQMRDLLDDIKGFLDGEDQDAFDKANDLQRDFWDMDQEFWWAVNDLWDQNREVHDKTESKRVIADADRQLSDMEQECEREGCTSQLKEIFKIAEAGLAEMKKHASAGNFEEFWFSQENFWDASQNFWDIFGSNQQHKDLKRQLHDFKREIKDRGFWLKDLKREGLDETTVNKLKALLSDMEKILREAETAYNEKDYDTAGDKLHSDFHEVRIVFDDMMDNYHRNREHEWRQQEIKFMRKEIEEKRDDIKEAAANGRLDQALEKECIAFADDALKLMDSLEKALNTKDWSAVENSEEELHEVGMRAERICGDVFHQEVDYENFNQFFVEEDKHEIAKRFYKDISEDITGEFLSEIQGHSALFNQILEKINQEIEKQVAQAVEAITFMVEDAQKEILSLKSSLLEKTQELDELKGRLDDEQKSLIKDIEKEVANYNFYGEAGKKLEEDFSDFLEKARGGKLSAPQMKAKLKKLKERLFTAQNESREEKCKNDVIPFCDTDDHEWYTRFFVDNLFKGTGDSGGTKVEPGRDTNLAEAITLFGRVLGAGDDDNSCQAQTEVGKRMPSWAMSGVCKLEDHDVDLDKIFGNKQAYDTITRGETAWLLKLAFKLPDADTDKYAKNFADIDSASVDEMNAIAAVNKAGFMTGEGDGKLFNVEGALNRAAFAKVLKKAIGITGDL